MQIVTLFSLSATRDFGTNVGICKVCARANVETCGIYFVECCSSDAGPEQGSAEGGGGGFATCEVAVVGSSDLSSATMQGIFSNEGLN